MVFLRAVAVGVTVGLLVWAACTALNLAAYGGGWQENRKQRKEEKRLWREAAETMADEAKRDVMLVCMIESGILPKGENGFFCDESMRKFEKFYERLQKQAKR